MKVRIIIIAFAFFSITKMFGQQESVDSIFYYYNGEKTYIPINRNEFTVYITDTNSFHFKKLLENDVKIINRFTATDAANKELYGYQIHFDNGNHDNIVSNLKNNEIVYAVEPVIGNGLTHMVSKYFYVKLRHTDDYPKLMSLSEQCKVKIINKAPYCDDWFILESNKKSNGNSIESSNYFWETGIFEDVDPGFIFNFHSNSFCVTDSSFSSQWGMSSINACSAWNITTGDTSVRIAVIDMGVDENHIELNGTNVSYSYDITSNSSPAQTRYKIENGKKYHGIHVGGIIFANHNANRVAGISPGASLINISHDLKVNTIVDSWELGNAIILAVIQGAKIINNSWGDQGGEIEKLKSKYLEYTINYAIDNNCVVVFAIGNKAPAMDYPATYRKEILTVGAISRNHTRASYSGYGDNLDVVAPGDSIYSTHNNNGYVTMNGTSMAAPHVSGIAALVLSVNHNLTGQQVRDIIESTAQKLNGYSFQPPSSDHPNGTWNNQVGYGLVDAYAAVQKAVNHHNDLYIRDTVTDDGSMPSSCYSTWDSPDIWVETLDGDYVAHPHGNTKYAVCVKIHNRRDVASSGTERLFLNWAKAGFNDSWDEYWTGNNPLPCGAPKGGVIGSANGKIIPSIPANSYRIDTIHWITPAGENYANCTDFNYNQWHFCLLARIHDDDVIAHENEHDADVHQLVKNHNNVAQQNVYLDSAENYRKTLGIGNVHTIDMSRIICLVPKVVGNISITDFAEVYITLDAGLLAAINSANISGLTWVNSNTLRWNGGSASIPVTLPANSYYTLQTTVHFIADQIPASNNFDFDIVLRSATGDSILGGEHYRCVRTNGRFFQTCISRSESVLWGESVTLTACDIEEDAEYIWYDNQGEEVGYGLTCDVAPLQPTTYTLRVTADEDGYRTYCQLTVNVTDGELRLLAPNPADNQVRIGYALSRKTAAATLQILNGSGQVVYSQAIGGGNGSKVTGEAVVNTSSLAAGSYTVKLISSGGNIYDNKTLIIK